MVHKSLIWLSIFILQVRKLKGDGIWTVSQIKLLPDTVPAPRSNVQGNWTQLQSQTVLFHFHRSLCGGHVSGIYKVNEGQVRPTVVAMGYFAYLASIWLLLATTTLIFFREPLFPHSKSKWFGWVDPAPQYCFRNGHRTLTYQSIPSSWTWRLI